MCEYCGCQALSVIELLTREHDRALDHVRAVEHAAGESDRTAARSACTDLRALLLPHERVEEEGLFPALSADFPDQMAALVHDHRQLEDVLVGVLSDEPLPPDWSARLTEAMGVLREHILKEQDGAFPAALSTLSASSWENAERVRSRVGSALSGQTSAAAS
jgi:hemerythrin-like domain-containing protein